LIAVFAIFHGYAHGELRRVLPLPKSLSVTEWSSSLGIIALDPLFLHPKLYEAAGVLQISPASTNPLLTVQGRDNVFRVIGRDDAQGIVAGNYLADQLASLVTANTNATGRYRARCKCLVLARRPRHGFGVTLQRNVTPKLHSCPSSALC
jgi:hypothetical protein